MEGTFFGGGGFGGGRARDPFAAMHQAMMNPGMGGGNTTSFYSSSTMGGGFPGGGTSVSRSTTTRIVNGRTETVTETVIHKADGTVERKVETHGGDGSSARLTDGNQRQRQQLLGESHPRSTSGGSSRQSEEVPKRKRVKHRTSNSER